MARIRAPTAEQRALSSPASDYQGNRPQGIRPRQGSSQERATRRAERNRPRPATPSETPTPQEPPAPVLSRGRKRKHSIEDAVDPDPGPNPDPDPDPDPKRQRASPPRSTADAFDEPAIGSGTHKHTDPVAFWAKEGRWPEEHSTTYSTKYRRLLPRKKSSPSLSQKRSISATSTTPSDQMPREEQSAPFRAARYLLVLQTKDSYLADSELGITDVSKHLVRDLLCGEQPAPKGTPFDDDIFVDVCLDLEDSNEPRVIQDISRLIVPSARMLSHRNKNYRCLVESVNEGWDHSVPLASPRPQPDYSVGFGRNAFTKDQLAKLSPFVGDIFAGDQSLFMATYYMYFPFLTCEVKGSLVALDIADLQNAHSMTLAVRGVAELFRAVQREDEVNRKILAFSISHNHREVRIYGHYPVIIEKDIKYYRHRIRDILLRDSDGKDKWTAYRFVKNIYDAWMPAHFKNICSAIDQLPDLNFDVPPLSEAGNRALPEFGET